MARIAKPWWWEERGGWYATVRGVRHRLAGGRKGLPEARKRLAALLTAPGPGDAVAAPPAPSIGSVGVAYLEEAAARVGAGTLADASRVQMVVAIKPFCLAHGHRPLAALTPELVAAWVDRPSWGRTTRVSVARRLRTLARWAHRRGLADRDPLAGLVCGAAGRRDFKATGEEVRRWLAAIRNPAFADFARFVYLTGCRRGEAASVEASMIDFAAGVATLAHHKTERFGRPRRIVMVPEAVEIARRWATRYPDGPLFRNSMGTAWTKENEHRKAIDTSKRSGIKLTLHMLRHSLATRHLQAGTPVAVVAALLGHSNPAVTMTIYCHVIENLDVLRDAAARLID